MWWVKCVCRYGCVLVWNARNFQAKLKIFHSYKTTVTSKRIKSTVSPLQRQSVTLFSFSFLFFFCCFCFCFFRFLFSAVTIGHWLNTHFSFRCGKRVNSFFFKRGFREYKWECTGYENLRSIYQFENDKTKKILQFLFNLAYKYNCNWNCHCHCI